LIAAPVLAIKDAGISDMIDIQIRVKVDLKAIAKQLLALVILLAR